MSFLILHSCLYLLRKASAWRGLVSSCYACSTRSSALTLTDTDKCFFGSLWMSVLGLWSDLKAAIIKSFPVAVFVNKGRFVLPHPPFSANHSSPDCSSGLPRVSLSSFLVHFLVSTVEGRLHVSSAHTWASVKAFVKALQNGKMT